MSYLRPESSMFCTSSDCTGPTHQTHWSTDCNSLIFGSHFFGAYFICLFINSPKPSLAPISPFWEVWLWLAPTVSHTYPQRRKEWKGIHPLARKGEDCESCPFPEDLLCKTGKVDWHCTVSSLLTLAISYMTEILNSQSMNVPSG